LRRWIIIAGGCIQAVPAYVAWVYRLGVIAENNQSAITSSTIAVLAERFRSSGGILIPDEPNTAIAMIFKTTKGCNPESIRPVHDEKSEVEMSRIENIVFQLKQCGKGLIETRELVRNTIEDLERFRARISQVAASETLKGRTFRNELDRLQRQIENYERRERQQREIDEKRLRQEFEGKVRMAVDAITNVKSTYNKENS
jgi:hypothetical protein